MSVYQILGAVMLGSLFLGGFAFYAVEFGWREAALTWGFPLGLAAFVVLAAFLLSGGVA